MSWCLMGLDFRVRMLGPLVIYRKHQQLDLGPPRRRVLLIRLLIEKGRAVTMDLLREDLWQGRPPPSATATLHAHLSRLRALLEPERRRRDRGEVLVTEPTGYALRLPDEVRDTVQFEQAVTTARDLLADGNAPQARAEIDAALALWRGAAHADAENYGFVIGETARLTELRLQAEETRTAALLHEGAFDQAVLAAEDLTARYPLREGVWNLLMQALYLAGRPADALRRFAEVRHRLAEEFGLDPGVKLRDTYQAILNQDVDLLRRTPSVSTSLPPTSATVDRPSKAVPRPAQLPPDLPVFVGRSAELAQSWDLLSDFARKPAPLIRLIDGVAGGGKTALAIHWSHQAIEHFPDGQLFMDMRGLDQTGHVVDPAAALHDFLQAFGVPAEHIPVSPNARIALYRSLMASRQVLVVLDNARDENQVRPLLPGTPGSAVIVTSRNPLPGLIISNDARPLTLNVFGTDEAHQALARRLGPDRIAAEPAAVRDIIDLCGRLPLALSIVAVCALTRPGRSLAHIAAELHRASGSLDVFAGTDAHTNVRAVFSWSYNALRPDTARLFRLLTLHPGTEITTTAAARLAGRPASSVQSLLTELTRAHLLKEQEPGRFVFPDLIRVYAHELVTEHDSAADRRAAVARLKQSRSA